MKWSFVCFSVVMLLCLPTARVEAAAIQCFDPASPSCTPIGQFAWDVDVNLGDDVFTLINLTDPASGSAFDDVMLVIDLGSPENLGSVAAGGQTDTAGLLLLIGSSEADLSFTFMSGAFASTLVTPGAETIYAELAVPEPTTLMLLLTGALGFGISRRRRG
jgi:hypothetical protein